MPNDLNVPVKFEIKESMSDFSGYTPTTDSYQVMLTSQPSADVVVAVVPQPTPTYNAAQAFNPAANYGQNNDVQVRVATTRATFLLAGVPVANEAWSLTLDDGSNPVKTATWVVVSGDTLASLAGHLKDAVNGFS